MGRSMRGFEMVTLLECSFAPQRLFAEELACFLYCLARWTFLQLHKATIKLAGALILNILKVVQSYTLRRTNIYSMQMGMPYILNSISGEALW